MRVSKGLRFAAPAVAVSAVALFAAMGAAPKAATQPGFVQNGEAGFVVSYIEYALSKDASETGACPNGMTLGGNRLIEAIQAGRVPPPAPGSQAAQLMQYASAFNGAAAARARAQGAAGGAPAATGAQGNAAANGQTTSAAPATPAQAGSATPAAAQQRRTGYGRFSGPNACSNPEQFGADPYVKTVTGRNVPAYGISLSGPGGHAAANTCAHETFRGFNGERGIDNQFFRAVGCSPSFQPTGMSVGWNTEMLTGAWGVLIRLRGVDDIRNDNDVQVGIYANADPIQLSPNREPLAGATYAAWQDPRFRAETHGRIVNGVLTTDPVNVRFWKITNSVWLERPLDAARLQVRISADGAVEGYMAGYTPVEAMYDLQFAYRNGKTGPGGAPAPGALGSAMGRAFTVGDSCNGAYYALQAMADGERDPRTGRCNAISTQYHIRAIPAFVVDAATQSQNANLGQPAATDRGY